MSQPKQDRFAAYNAEQKKHPPMTTIYPMMLQNDDGTTTIVQNEEEHKIIAGKNFAADSYRGARSGKKEYEPPVANPQINIPENARNRRGSKATALDGTTVEVGPQTIGLPPEFNSSEPAKTA